MNGEGKNIFADLIDETIRDMAKTDREVEKIRDQEPKILPAIFNRLFGLREDRPMNRMAT